MSKREAVIVGVADLPLKDGKVAVPMSVLQAQALCARDALADAGIPMHAVDGLLTAGMWGVPGPGQLATVTLSEYLGIAPRFVDGTNIGGSAFEAHVAHAATAIEAGRCEVALITYGSLQRSEASRNLAGRPSVLTMQYETPWGMPTPVGGYALAAMRHMHEHGTTSQQLAEIAVATRRWAALNPDWANSALVTIAARCPQNASVGWNDAGSIRWRASPFAVDQRKMLSTSWSTATRYPTTPCSPGVRPVAMLVRAVAVVEGETLVMGPPAMVHSVGARAVRSWSWSQPRPSRTRSTTWAASSARAGSHGGGSTEPSSSDGTMFEMHAPP